MERSTHLTKAELQRLDNAKRTQDLIRTYREILDDKGETAAREWYNCWFGDKGVRS